MTGPFESSLGKAAMETLPDAVRAHLTVREGSRRYRGVMHVVWRRGGLRGVLALPILQLAARAETLFPETGRNIPFVLENVCVPVSPDHTGCQSPAHSRAMRWRRQFFFNGKMRCFTAEMYFDASCGTVVDWLGNRRRLEVELHPVVANGGLQMKSGKQFLRTRFGRLPLPRLLTGHATVREDQIADGKLKIQVIISNPLLGSFFGYEGEFTEDKAHSQ